MQSIKEIIDIKLHLKLSNRLDNLTKKMTTAQSYLCINDVDELILINMGPLS